MLVGILHTDTTTVAWSIGLHHLKIPGGILPVTGMPFDHARNEVCKHGLAHGATHIFMLDSDVIPPPDAILRLLRHRQPIVSGVYFRRSPPQGLPVMQRGGRWVADYPANSLIEVDVVGSGCLLLSRQFLEDMRDRFSQEPSNPWFCWKVNRAGYLPAGEMNMSEDFTLCWHARKNGYKVLVDTGVLCKHVGYAAAERNSFQPLHTA